MRIRIGSAFKIPIYLHWTFFLLPFIVRLFYNDKSPFSLPVTLTGVLIVFCCVVLHEFGHVLAARSFGIGTKDVTLYPIGGVARLLKMSEKPLEEILIAIAGPAVNVVIAVAMASVMLPLHFANRDFFGDTFVSNVAWFVLYSNCALVVFNMLPLFPMDGGRVLRALLSWGFGHYRATQIAVGIALGMAVLLGSFAFVTGSFMFVIIAVFVFLVGQQELLVARMQHERRRQQEEEEPLEVLPVARPVWPPYGRQSTPVPPALVLQPKISVYTWDNQTGTWRKEPGRLLDGDNRMTPLLARLDSWLAKHRRRFHKNLQPGATAAELAELSKALGKPVPAELAAWLSWHNGQGDDYVGYFVDHWLLMSAAKIAAAKADLDVNGIEYCWNKNWLPLLDDDGGNFIVLDLSSQPAPVLIFWMGEKTEPAAKSLEAWLSDLVTAIEAGQYHEEPERGMFMRRKKSG